MNFFMRANYRGGQGYSEGPSDWFGNNLVFWMNPSRLSSMMVEQAFTGVPVTPVANDGTAVGFIYDQGYHSQIIRAESDARRPMLGSDTVRNAYLTFDGSDDFLRVANTQKYFNAFHKASPVFSIALWVRMGAGSDADSQYFFGSNTNSTANAGISLERTTGNKVKFFAAKASAGNAVWNYTSTASLTVASGFTLIMIEVNGTGAAAGRIKVGSSAWETFTVNAGAAVDATSDLLIGALNGPTAGSYFKGDLGDVIFLNRTLTAEDITNLEGFNPSKSTTEFVTLQWDIDFDASTRIFADTTGTTPITDGTAIRLIRHNQDSIFGELGRHLTSAASGSSPVWRDNNINGRAAAEYDGVDDNLDFNMDLFTEAGGKWTEFVVIKNEDATVGSNFLKGSSGYQVLTGSNYSGNSNNNGESYFLLHTSMAGGMPDYNSLAVQIEGYNILVFRRDGSSWSSWNTTKTKKTGTNAGQHMIQDMGEQFNANFWTDGMFVRLIKYCGVMTDGEVESKIDELKALYGL